MFYSKRFFKILFIVGCILTVAPIALTIIFRNSNYNLFNSSFSILYINIPAIFILSILNSVFLWISIISIDPKKIIKVYDVEKYTIVKVKYDFRFTDI